MATERANPYGAFNFLVTVDRLNGGGGMNPQGGFQEISGLNIEVTVAEYRNGNDRQNHTRKLNTLAKAGDVTLKRGVIGTLDLYKWINDVRNGVLQAGDRGQSYPVVRIELLDETHSGPVLTWKLHGARPMKYTAPTFNAKTATDVAIEELVLSVESVEIE